jgi:hypothetical protein
MCFFKTLPTPPAISSEFDRLHKHFQQDSSEELGTETELGSPCCQKVEVSQVDNMKMMLISCLGMVNLNSQMMNAMDEVISFFTKKLSHAEELLTAGHDMLAA